MANKPTLKEVLLRKANPYVAYGSIFGTLALAIGLGLIICL